MTDSVYKEKKQKKKEIKVILVSQQSWIRDKKDLKESSDFGNVMGYYLPVAPSPAAATHCYLKVKDACPRGLHELCTSRLRVLFVQAVSLFQQLLKLCSALGLAASAISVLFITGPAALWHMLCIQQAFSTKSINPQPFKSQHSP